MNPNFTALARAWATGQPSEQPTLELQPIPAALFRVVELLVTPPTRRRRGAVAIEPPGSPGRVHRVATAADDEPELELQVVQGGPPEMSARLQLDTGRQVAATLQPGKSQPVPIDGPSCARARRRS